MFNKRIVESDKDYVLPCSGINDHLPQILRNRDLVLHQVDLPPIDLENAEGPREHLEGHASSSGGGSNSNLNCSPISIIDSLPLGYHIAIHITGLKIFKYSQKTLYFRIKKLRLVLFSYFCLGWLMLACVLVWMLDTGFNPGVYKSLDLSHSEITDKPTHLLPVSIQQICFWSKMPPCKVESITGIIVVKDGVFLIEQRRK